MVKKPVFRSNPEARIQRALIAFLGARGWFVRSTHGNAYQSGFPDLFVSHPQYGYRWIDVKNPARYRYTQAQIIEWPKWEAGGVGIWILFAADENNYSRLFKPPNFREYWKPAYDKKLIPIKKILEELG